MRIPSVGILEQPSAAPIPFPQTWAAPTGVQSSFGATGAFYLNPNYATGDVPDSYIEIPDTQTVALNTQYVIPPGWGGMIVTSGTTAAQYQVQQPTSSGGAAGNWVTLATGTASVAVWMFFMSDGVNFRINSPTTATTVVFYRFR
jgi:hypothetical protein